MNKAILIFGVKHCSIFNYFVQKNIDYCPVANCSGAIGEMSGDLQKKVFNILNAFGEKHIEYFFNIFCVKNNCPVANCSGAIGERGGLPKKVFNILNVFGEKTY